MDELFGIPLGTLLAILVGATGAGIGVLAVLALRNRMLVRLAVRNAGRRRARTALIVTGLMLGTTIVAAALTTGDTMARTIRQTAVTAMGSTDEVVAAAGSMADVPGEVGDATGPRYVDASIVPTIDAALRREGLTDGVTGAIVAPVALQAPTRRQAEPRVTLFAADPARMAGFDAIHGSDGEVVTLASLGIADGYLNQEAADALTVRPGDVVDVFAGGSSTMRVRVRDVVRFDGAGTADEALLVPLATAQRLLGATGRVQHVLISNRGDDLGGVGLSDRVVRTLAPVVQPLGLEVTTVKRDAIDDAETAGTTFMAMFTTFGSFSIAAGVLLIFLIFVMLAAERRGELGIARAIGTRRGHLVELFVFEGVAYDLLAALVGAILGAAIAFGMVAAIAGAISATEADLDVVYAVSPRSLLVAFLLGVLLTVVVVTVSAWRVSRMTISTAIRNLPEPPAHRRRSRWLLGIVAIVLGVLLVLGGGSQATPLLLGISLVLVGFVPIARALGAPERPTFTLAGLLLVVIWMLPWRVWDTVFGELRMDFGTWITAGLMVVVGAVWLIVFNADVLIRLTIRVFGRIGRVAPVIRVAAAYPAAARFRTATTLAMFTLVVFTLVTGVAAPGSFQAALEDVDRYGGGYDVRAATSGGAPIDDLAGAIRRTPGLRAADYTSVGSQSMLQVQARQLGTDRPEEAYVARGLDDGFLAHTTYGFGALANGYGSAREVWHALRTTPGLAVVDSTVVPRRDNFGFEAAPPDFRVTGFYVDDGHFAPFDVEVRDEQTGVRQRLTVIGVLGDAVPYEMVGISTSQTTLMRSFPGRARPTIHYLTVAPGVDPDAAAQRLEAAFLPAGLEADSMQTIVDRMTGASRTFNRLIQGFMALGLVVGVAALGVISARAVVERRQQIGVMRAIGFRRGMVQAAFLLESAFVALTAILVGTALGLLLAFNIVDDQRQQPSWADLDLVVPWGSLLLIFSVVFGVALAATFAPAMRAARTSPAEALRYE